MLDGGGPTLDLRMADVEAAGHVAGERVVAEHGHALEDGVTTAASRCRLPPLQACLGSTHGPDMTLSLFSDVFSRQESVILKPAVG
jgi:hypothetical protein